MTPVERAGVGVPEALVASVLARHPVIDGHNDLIWHARKHHGYDWDQFDVGGDLSGTGAHTDLQRMRAGGVGAQFWSVYVPSRLTPEEILTATFEQIDAVHALVRKYGDRLALATGAADIEAAWSSGRIASLLGAEGGHQIGGSLAVLRAMQALGVRYLTLTHNDNIAWADSATDRPVLGGLSDFGREVVREMNRIGMLVDLSHVSADVMRQALEISTAPVIFSHSSARAICPHPRNVPDDVLTGLKVNGGVCMVTFVPWFVTPAVHEWDLAAQDAAWAVGIDSRDVTTYQPFAEQWAKKVPPPASTVADVVAHLEHVRDVAGIEHVGLGGDYDGVEWLPEGLDDVSGYPRLLVALAERGWSKADLAALTCRNTLRVLDDAGCRSTGPGQAEDPKDGTTSCRRDQSGRTAVRVGVPKEVKNHEYRVAITPVGVHELVAHGHEVFVERGAGLGSSISDAEYAGAGARLLDDADEVWATAEMVLKVKEPVAEEYHRLRAGLVLFTYLHLAADQPLTEELAKRKVTGIAYETVQLPSGGLPLLYPMSEVAGCLAPQVGAYSLLKAQGGRGVLLGGVGGVANAKVVIIGAGVSGQNAANIALGMGADVTLLDTDLDKLRMSFWRYNNRVHGLASSKLAIQQHVMEADMVIGAVLVPGAKAPKLVSNDLVAAMKPGSVLVDIAVDQGGCFSDTRPTTHADPTYQVHGSTFYCVANMPGAVPNTSTYALTNATLPYAVALADKGWLLACQQDPSLALGLNTHAGDVTYAPVAEAHQMAAVTLESVLTG